MQRVADGAGPALEGTKAEAVSWHKSVLWESEGSLGCSMPGQDAIWSAHGLPEVRFHDDKTTYTGTHARGGPESVPKATQSAHSAFGFGY